jgi:uridylate kinase
MKPVITLSIGGSLMVPNSSQVRDGKTVPAGEPDIEYINQISKLLLKLSSKYRFAIVTGGGAAARVYARAMKKIRPP